MAELRFIHAADLHLGRPFSGLTRSSPELGTLVSRAAYVAWNRLVKAAVDRGVDFVTIAGDVFDRGSPAIRPRVAFRDGVLRLHKAGIPVYLALGNHDPLGEFPDILRSLPGLEVFGPSPEVKHFHSASLGQRVGLHGISFAKPAVRDNLVARIRRNPHADLAIGVIHANVSGVPGHDDYAPCSLDDLRAAGMDVWCLGHVHRHTMLSSEPLILYPGSLQGAHVNESGPHGCVIVAVDESGRGTYEFLDLAPVRWEHRDVDVSGVSAAEEVLDAMEQACESLIEETEDLDAHVMRFNLTGTAGPWLSELRLLDSDGWETLSERLAGLAVPVFSGSVRDLTKTAVDREGLLKEEGFLAEFIALCRDTGANAHAASELLQEVAGELAKLRLLRFVDGEFDLRRLHDDPAERAEVFRHVEETVLKLFLNAVEDKR